MAAAACSGGGTGGGGSDMQRQQQHDYGCIFVTLIGCLTTLLNKVFSFNDFFRGQGRGRGRDGTGRDGQTNKQTYGQTDFSLNVLIMK